MGEPILVIVGEWECGDDGEWKFVVEKNLMAQTILLTERMTYSDLKERIGEEFELKGQGVEPNISFWLPSELSILSTKEAPPVCVKSDTGLETFRAVRRGRKWLSLFVSFSTVKKVDPIRAPIVERHWSNLLPGQSSRANWDDGVIRLEDSTPSSSPGISPTQRNVMVGMSREYNRGRRDKPWKGKGKALRFETDSEDTSVLRPVVQTTDTGSGSTSPFWQEFLAPDIEPEQWDRYQAMLDAMETPAVDMDTGTETSSQRSFAVVPEVGQGTGTVQPNEGGLLVGQSSNPITVGDGDDTGWQCSGEASDGLDEEVIEYEVHCTLSNLYADIREGTVLPIRDAPPAFDDGYVLTGKAPDVDPRDIDDALYLGRVFKNKEEMQIILAIHAIKRLFTFKQDKSDKKRLIVSCVDDSCPWRVFGHVLGGESEHMEIRTMNVSHTCDVRTRSQYSKKASAKVIAHVLKNKFANGKVGPRVIEIPPIVQESLRVSVTYMQAWYAKERAVATSRGSEEKSYKLLNGYMRRLAKTNPGTVYKIKADVAENGDRRFKFLFFSLGASIQALPYLRKVIIIDGTAIKAKFQGCMVTASLQDGNFKVFPLAFGVVDGENQPAWTWFLSQLSTILPDSPNIVFMSDRHSSIYGGLQTVYPLAHHSACSVHLYRNVNARFKVEGLGYLVSRAARSYSVAEFRYWFSEIERQSPGCAEYLMEIGLPHWTTAYCYGMRYNISTTNIAETLNSTLAKALQFPIVSMVETIRMMLMQWFCWRRAKAAKETSVLTPEVEDLLLKHMDESGSHTVIPSTDWIYQVNTSDGIRYTVNLLHKTCTCKLFEKLLLPCSHAIAAARSCDIPIPTMSDHVYKMPYHNKVYEGIVMPVENMEDEEVQEEEEDDNIVHPKAKRGTGRPRKRRIPSTGEIRHDLQGKRRRTGLNKCSRCFEPGHNRLTCKNALP